MVFFCLKGIMSREDALKAVDIGADAIMISNHEKVEDN